MVKQLKKKLRKAIGHNEMTHKCEGILRVRGFKKNLTRFFLDDLLTMRTFNEPNKLELNDRGDIIYSDTELPHCCWIRRTWGGIICFKKIPLSQFKDEDPITLYFDVRFESEVHPIQLQMICKMYGIDMRVHVFKETDEFEQEIEILNGKVIKDVEMTADGDVLYNIHQTLEG